jgi:hypothetical protein
VPRLKKDLGNAAILPVAGVMLFPTAGLAAMPDQQPSRVALTQMIFVSFLSQLGPSHFCLIDS